jgi:cytochrome c
LLSTRLFMKNLFSLSLLTLSLVGLSGAVRAQATAEIPEDMKALMTKYTCIACHKTEVRQVGPAYKEVAKKKYTNAQIVELIYAPVPSHWPGYPPMAAMKQVPKEDALKLAVWINTLDDAPVKKSGAKKSKKA